VRFYPRLIPASGFACAGWIGKHVAGEVLREELREDARRDVGTTSGTGYSALVIAPANSADREQSPPQPLTPRGSTNEAHTKATTSLENT
jgi:hypothetical protein